MKKLTIVVPMYNEEEMIPLFFETINRHSHHMCECLFSNLQTIISSF